jgi:hypothetical protein
LEGNGVGVVPIVLATKRIKSGGKFRGGVSSYQQFKRDLQRLLGDRSAAAITMMLDYYGLPKDFPGAGTQRGHTCYDRATHLQESLQSDLQDRRLIPYLSLHEFEALLFTSPETLAGTLLKPQVLRQLAAMVEGVESPEEINDGASTHPSARIKRLLPTYSKSLHGPLIVQRIGLTEIRRHCPHFAWAGVARSRDLYGGCPAGRAGSADLRRQPLEVDEAAVQRQLLLCTDDN